MSKPAVSVVIPTRNRAEFLRRTLGHLARLEAMEGLECELVIVDNGSADETPAVASAAHLPWGSVRVLREDRAGASRARNRAVEETTSDLILFLDDDVKPSPNWLRQMVSAFTDPKVMVVGGGVRLDPTLCPEWMTPWHHTLFASTEYPEISGNEPRSANIGFRRACFEGGARFDPEIGAGTAYGFAEEYLFLQGIKSEGGLVEMKEGLEVVHEFDVRRLTIEAFLRMARQTGASGAYAMYHYGNVRPKLVGMRAIWAGLRADRLIRKGFGGRDYLMREEYMRIQRASMLKQFTIEVRRTPNYDYPNRIKQRGILV